MTENIAARTHTKKKGQFSSEFLLNNTSSYFETKGKKPKPIKKIY